MRTLNLQYDNLCFRYGCQFDFKREVKIRKNKIAMKCLVVFFSCGLPADRDILNPLVFFLSFFQRKIPSGKFATNLHRDVYNLVRICFGDFPEEILQILYLQIQTEDPHYIHPV